VVLHSRLLPAGGEGRNAAKAAIAVAVEPELLAVAAAAVDLLKLQIT